MLSSSKNKKTMLTFIQPKQKARSIQPTQQCKWCQTIKEKEKKKNNSRFWFFKAFSTLTISLSFSWPAWSSQVGEINVCATYKWGWSYVIWPTWLVNIYIISFKLICFIHLIKRYWIPWLKNFNNFGLIKIK